MKLENLKPAKGATHNSKRVGRGQGSGKGGTATRGTKGAQARAGYEHKIGFEGGQMPIQRRLPKFGFKNPTRVEYRAINLKAIENLAAGLGVSELGVEDFKAATAVSHAGFRPVCPLSFLVRPGIVAKKWALL